MKTFQDWLKEAFIHPSDIPVNFAMSIHRILHNKADFSDWEMLDEMVSGKGLEFTLKSIEKILKANGMDDYNIRRELNWFVGQITGSKNN